MERLKEMVELPTENDDFSSIEEAFEGFKVDESTNRLEHLKPPARRGIKLLVYKFGKIIFLHFYHTLDLSARWK